MLKWCDSAGIDYVIGVARKCAFGGDDERYVVLRFNRGVNVVLAGSHFDHRQTLARPATIPRARAAETGPKEALSFTTSRWATLTLRERSGDRQFVLGNLFSV
jgi:hypothetical protein